MRRDLGGGAAESRAGPFGLLNLLDERCGGVFDDIDAVIPAAERDAFMSRYKSAPASPWRR